MHRLQHTVVSWAFWNWTFDEGNNCWYFAEKLTNLACYHPTPPPLTRKQNMFWRHVYSHRFGYSQSQCWACFSKLVCIITILEHRTTYDKGTCAHIVLDLIYPTIEPDCIFYNERTMYLQLSPELTWMSTLRIETEDCRKRCRFVLWHTTEINTLARELAFLVMLTRPTNLKQRRARSALGVSDPPTRYIWWQRSDSGHPSDWSPSHPVWMVRRWGSGQPVGI